ncbi:TVP38/TMEM64 family protein [Halomonas stenophila]|uniref:TVP38/TMEM64 family membrane protein n=1 Tax=Halomonas stenophila TaxID=795312 RepID=A0A7W5ETQ2_9GAMM|nr:TVP38/TMEM64 family protein [Halomonas stenophila]MBB3231171.1 putative membrane protein YdjX (TVP38/TMEM64 family) [Halomonas stenophila]
MTSKLGVKHRLILGATLLIGLAALYWALLETGALSIFSDKRALREWVGQLGFWGPLAIMAMMIAAIVMSPIPSGPIAMAAGASYGPVWGTVYVVIGAEAGALIAFGIARLLGYEAMHRWSRIRPMLAWLEKERSQTGLMLVVFASRLVPFISFDAVSYAAGLTPLAFWRFLIATLAGVIPTAYLIVIFGEVLITADSRGLTVALILISGITLFPILAKLVWALHRKRRNSSN